MADNTEEQGQGSREPDNDGGDEFNSRGNGWEVVSLTASTYAASPGLKGPEPVHEEKGSVTDDGEEAISRALFMSGHFAFPPRQQENLSTKEEDKEMHKKEVGEQMVSEVQTVGGDGSQQKKVDNLSISGLNAPQDFPGIQVFDGKGDSRPIIDDSDFDETTLLCKANVMDKELTTLGGSASLHELNELLERGLDPFLLQSQLSGNGDKDDADDKDDGHELPSGSWWKRLAARLRVHAKETNAFWSIFIVAAITGLVVLGQKWQQERSQVLQQKWQLSLSSSEKPGKAVGSLSRFKDIIVGGSRRASYISNSGVAADL
ncbi:hypothetical protein Dimus_025275 [Dionaea muscipula]